MNECGWADCFTCPHADCIIECDEDLTPKKDRTDYLKQWYLNSKKPKMCYWCGKELHGEVIRMSKHNFCDINCVTCQLIKENEHKMSLYMIKEAKGE